MKFHSQEVVERVRKERKKGLSIRKLEETFGIPNTTISRWVRDIKSDSPAFKRAREKENKWKGAFKRSLDDFDVNDKGNVRVLLSVLYWCEGHKPPASNFVGFTNSDYALVRTFVLLLRTGFDIKEEKLKAYLQIHSTHDYGKLLKFWSGLLGIPPERFYKPTVTKPTRNMKRRNYLGTCTVKYFDVKLLYGIVGLYERFAEKYGGD